MPSSTLLHVNVLLVAGTGIVGLVAGAVLDPVGQSAAERSRRDDARRRAEREAETAVQAGSAHAAGTDPGTDADADTAAASPAGPVPSPGSDRDEPAADAVGADDAGTTAGTEHADRAGEPGGTPSTPEPEEPARVPDLVPAGRCPSRTVAASVITGALFAGAALRFGAHLSLAPFCVFFALLVVTSVTDLSHRLVPRRLVYPALLVIIPLLVMAAGVDHEWYHLPGAAIGGVVSFIAFFTVWFLVPRGMGFGDVRLAGVIGMTVGWLNLLHVYVAFLSGFILGMLLGVALMGLFSSGRRTRIPFAPALSAGAVIAVFWGSQMAQAFFGRTG